MSEFDKISKELTAQLKKNAALQEGPNASEYRKFLKKTLEKSQTFHSESPTYINYATGEKTKTKKISRVGSSESFQEGPETC